MRESRQRGFTLVELLVTIILLEVIGAIVIYNMTSVSKNSKELEYQRFVAMVKSAAETYSELNPEPFKDLYINKAFLYIEVGDLIDAGTLSDDLVNPYTEEVIGRNEQIKANLATENGALTFEYPIGDEPEESFLVALSDYVIYQEPYNCLQGAGTYQLAISEQDGTLIHLTEENIKKYNFTCEYPSSFKDYTRLEWDEKNTGLNYDSVKNALKKGKYVDDPGSYEITYHWKTDSGTLKKATRILRVQPKVQPSFIIKEETANDYMNATPYDYWHNSIPYVPKYVGTNRNKYLTYTPYFEGADAVDYVIKKRVVRQDKDDYFVPGGVDWETVPNSSTGRYLIDDGIKQYYLRATIKGHYIKEYQYIAENFSETEDSEKNEEKQKNSTYHQELVVPTPLISYDQSGWTTDKNLTISSGVHSPVGVAYYEYRLLESSTTVNNNNEVNENTFDTEHSEDANVDYFYYNDTHKLERINTSRSFSIAELGKCQDKTIEYNRIAVRAINDDHYIGAWQIKDINLTSDLTKLMASLKSACDSNTCIGTKDKGFYLTDKKAILNYPDVDGVDHPFVILEVFSDRDKSNKEYKNEILVTKDGVGINSQGINIKAGVIKVETCDLLSVANYRATNIQVLRIIQAANMGWDGKSSVDGANIVYEAVEGGSIEDGTVKKIEKIPWDDNLVKTITAENCNISERKVGEGPHCEALREYYKAWKKDVGQPKLEDVIKDLAKDINEQDAGSYTITINGNETKIEYSFKTRPYANLVVGVGDVVIDGQELTQGYDYEPINCNKQWKNIHGVYEACGVLYGKSVDVYAEDGEGIVWEHLNEHTDLYDWPVTYDNIKTVYYSTKFGQASKLKREAAAITVSSVFSNATWEHINRYKKAMYEDDVYWTVTGLSRASQIVATDRRGGHKKTVTYFNQYFYVQSPGSIADTNSTDAKLRIDRIASSNSSTILPVKPMVRFHNVNVCTTSTNDKGQKVYTIAKENVIEESRVGDE